MSKTDNFKDKIKSKSNAATEFFNQYDNVDDNNENKDGNNNDDNNKENVNIENKTYVNYDNNNNVDDNDIDMYLKGLAKGENVKSKKKKKVFTSFYMEPDLAIEVDKIAKKGQKGDKSKLINTAIRKLLKEYEVID